MHAVCAVYVCSCPGPQVPCPSVNTTHHGPSPVHTLRHLVHAALCRLSQRLKAKRSGRRRATRDDTLSLALPRFTMVGEGLANISRTLQLEAWTVAVEDRRPTQDHTPRTTHPGPHRTTNSPRRTHRHGTYGSTHTYQGHACTHTPRNTHKEHTITLRNLTLVISSSWLRKDTPGGR